MNPYGLHLNFYEDSPGEVSAEITVPDHFQGYPGVVHGGIIAAMLDEVVGRVYMDGDPPRFMVTARMEVRYRKPVPTGRRLKLYGHAGKDNGRIATANGEIVDESGVKLAEAEAVYVNIPQESIHQVDVEALGWKVVPDEEMIA